ncbi:MAG: UvrB/UvrC motif-containing protein [Pirellulales bacterium]
MKQPQHIDRLLKEWSYEPGEVLARRVRVDDDRDVLQMRIDMGLLQMEVDGRPDGSLPEGFVTYLDYLQAAEHTEGEDFELDDTRCLEVDREFVQFYHRRICWLALKDYDRAVQDADHTLTLMDFSSVHAPHEEWALSHEQYRPFVLFHRVQAAALAALNEDGPEKALDEVEGGLATMRSLFAQYGADEEDLEEDELVRRLLEVRDSLRKQFNVGPSLTEQLSAAVASEQYELAARLRDEIERRKTGVRQDAPRVDE